MTPSPAGRHPALSSAAPRSRRAVFKLGAVSFAALVVNACGGASKSSSGKAGAGGAATTAGGASSGPATTGKVGTTATTVKGSGAATTATAGGPSTPLGPVIPTGSQLTVDFTFAPGDSGFGPARNPYTSVWIEDAQGLVVRTLQVTFKSSEQRYLQELRRWFSGEQNRESAGGAKLNVAISGPTRVPGTYKIAWDGLDDGGKALAQADYFVCIEAAREHGPYQLVRDQVTVGTTAFQTTLTASGEITSASVDYKPA